MSLPSERGVSLRRPRPSLRLLAPQLAGRKRTNPPIRALPTGTAPAWRGVGPRECGHGEQSMVE